MSNSDQSLVLKENLQVREQNNKLRAENIDYRKRMQEMNELLASLIRSKAKQQSSDANANEQQISYGKKTESLLGSPGPLRSAVTEGDQRTSQIRTSQITVEQVEGSSDREQRQQLAAKETVLEHVKSNLKVYLMKSPIINMNNEIILKVLFSLLNFSKEDVDEVDQARKRLPVYKVDEKNTKKQEKAMAKSEPRDTSKPGMKGLFGRSKGGGNSSTSKQDES